MSFQFVLNNAQSLAVNRRPIVAQTQTRSGVTRSVRRGPSIWTIEAVLPEGARFSDYRTAITDLETLGRDTVEYIGFTSSGLNYLYGYQGDQPNPENITGTVLLNNNTITLTNGVTITSGFVFRKGDIFQIGDEGWVYQVIEDVPYNETVVKLHRNIVGESVGTYPLRIGLDAKFKIRCIQFPQWRLIDRDQVGWDSSFVFQEVLT